MSNEKVSFFISPSGDWNIELLKCAVGEEDIEIIRKIPINLAGMDKYVWHYDKCGNYSVKSGYKIFMKNRIRLESSNNAMAKVWSNLWRT